MWGLRRLSSSLKKQGFILGSSRISCITNEISSIYSAGNNEGFSNVVSDRSRFSFRVFCKTANGSSKLLSGHRQFSSLVGTKSSSEKDSDPNDELSELEADAEDELVSEPELSEEGFEGKDVETPQEKVESPREKVSTELFKTIAAAHALAVDKVMDKWGVKVYDFTREEIAETMINLRKRRMYGKALQLSEWLELKKQLTFTERDYAFRVDLIAKVRGLQRAASYIEKLPNSFRSEMVYRTLLANSASKGNLKKSEEIFNKMRDLGFPITGFSCSQLLHLYKRFNEKKIADVLLLMQKENIKPTPFIYQILIDVKGQSKDITGMEEIVETMKAEEVQPNIHTKGIMAKHYIHGGHVEKADNILKLMEGEMKENPCAYRNLLRLYATFGKPEDVHRIWQLCEPNARIDECMVAIEAWGKLHKVVEAEAVFDKMLNEAPKLTSKHYYPLLKVYARHKMLSKGEDLFKRMVESGCRIGSLIWDALIRLYIEVGEVEKADSVLQKAAATSHLKPNFSSYTAILEQYSKRGDVHNSEKLFYEMRKAGYVGRIRQFQCLILSYINAKAPCYGFAERMKADNVFPNKTLANMLSSADPFKKTAVSELLD